MQLILLVRLGKFVTGALLAYSSLCAADLTLNRSIITQRESFVTVRLDGEWQYDEGPDDFVVDYRYDGNTEFVIRLDHGLTREIRFVPIFN